MSVLNRAALAALPLLPAPIMRHVASRYFAGERLDDALGELEGLAEQGYTGILDLLGEDIETEKEAREVAATYAHAAGELAGKELDAYVSIKPTHLGLRVSEDLAFELYAELLKLIQKLDSFLRVEMEDHTTTDATLRLFERLRDIAPNHVGIVLQSRLLRTPNDVTRFAPGPLAVRMVKGIYLEPPDIAHTDPDPIRDAYVELSRALFERDARVSFATHDDHLATRLLDVVQQLGVPKDRYEFQVLMGVRRELWDIWRTAGHPVRVYVPYGPNWRAYSTRRLRKNPEIFAHVMRDLFRMR